jgi:uncharacterized membrane protein
LGVNAERPGTVQIAVSAVMVALVAVTTMLIQVPIPATDGFFNIGDAVIMVAALTFGPVIGAVAGGVGSSLADLLGGWYVWVVPTLLIKGTEGFLAGWIARRSRHRGLSGAILAWAVGALAMVLGYFAVQVLMYGVDAAFVEMPFNVVQVTVGGIVGLPVSQALKRRMQL